MNRIIGSTIILFLLCQITNAQITGISASKVVAYTVINIPHNTVEFEPSFGSSWSSRQYDKDGNVVNLYNSPDSASVSSGLAWRITYGLFDKMEIGTSFSPSFSSVSWSTKYMVIGNDKYGFSIMAGMTNPLGNRVYNKSQRTANDVTSYGLGLIGSWFFTDQLSLDINTQFQNYSESVNGVSDGDFFFSADIGNYILNNKILLLASFSHQRSTYPTLTQKKWTFSPGVSIEYANNFLVVVNGSFDFAGRNIFKQHGFGIALTTFLN